MVWSAHKNEQTLLSGTMLSGALVGVQVSQTHNGLAVVGKTVQLKPGQRVVIDYNLLTGKGQPGIPVLRVTPVTLGKDVIGASSGCS